MEWACKSVQGFFICPPCPKIFCILFCLREKSVRDADNIGLCDRLACCHCKFSALVEYLDDTFEWLLRIVVVTDVLVVHKHVRGGDADVLRVEVCCERQWCLSGVSCVRALEH